MRSLAYFSISLLWLLSASVLAEGNVEISEFGWFDQRHIDQQVQKVDDLARIKLGTQVHGDKSDLDLLQRVINKGLIAKDDALTQQALGAVLGNVMAKEFGLHWVRYKDEVGVSRALCVPNTQHCLFPITMLSRRMSVGILPNVNTLYSDTHQMILPHLPKSPYQVGTP